MDGNSYLLVDHPQILKRIYNPRLLKLRHDSCRWGRAAPGSIHARKSACYFYHAYRNVEADTQSLDWLEFSGR
jgi:hypothetical protein